MAATNYICLKPFFDNKRQTYAEPGMVVAFDPAVTVDLVSRHLKGGIIVLATAISATSDDKTLRALGKLATP